MNIPQELTQAEAKALASPQDTHAMRIIVRRVANQALYRLSGKRRRYVLEYCPKMNVHFIDVPFSVWSYGIDIERTYEDNFSVAHDIQANQQFAESLVVFPVPFGAASAPEAPASVLASLRALAARFGAPQVMLDAIDLVSRGLSVKATCLALDNTVPAGEVAPDLALLPGGYVILVDPETPPLPDSEPTPADAAERMRKMREAKAAKKAAASIM